MPLRIWSTAENVHGPVKALWRDGSASVACWATVTENVLLGDDPIKRFGKFRIFGHNDDVGGMFCQFLRFSECFAQVFFSNYVTGDSDEGFHPLGGFQVFCKAVLLPMDVEKTNSFEFHCPDVSQICITGARTPPVPACDANDLFAVGDEAERSGHSELDSVTANCPLCRRWCRWLLFEDSSLGIENRCSLVEPGALVEMFEPFLDFTETVEAPAADEAGSTASGNPTIDRAFAHWIAPVTGITIPSEGFL